MACILSIETSSSSCSVSVSQDGACIFNKETTEGPSHSTILGSYVDEALSFTDNHAIPFDAVAVSEGPGSYTGLRIGVSMAKGISYARDIKLISIPTLQLLCVKPLLSEEIPEGALICPMIDARRMEVYTALYDRALNTVEPVQAMVIDQDSFSDILAEKEIYFIGNGSKKVKDIIEHPNAHFISFDDPMAKYMFPLAEKKFLRGEFADIAYFEPFYLKDFIATKAKKLL